MANSVSCALFCSSQEKCNAITNLIFDNVSYAVSFSDSDPNRFQEKFERSLSSCNSVVTDDTVKLAHVFFRKVPVVWLAPEGVSDKLLAVESRSDISAIVGPDDGQARLFDAILDAANKSESPPTKLVQNRIRDFFHDTRFKDVSKMLKLLDSQDLWILRCIAAEMTYKEIADSRKRRERQVIRWVRLIKAKLKVPTNDRNIIPIIAKSLFQ